MGEPKLNLILDSRRIEKYQPLIDELKRQKIVNYELWPCLMYPKVVNSINASHKMIVWDAKEKGLKECYIGEDDLMFPSDHGWQWFLKNKPIIFDIYSAGNYLSFDRPKEPGAVKVDCIVGFHLYIIQERFYDTFLSTPDDQHIDTAQKGELFVCYPMPGLQRAGFSANNMAECNYNAVLNDEDIYK